MQAVDYLADEEVMHRLPVEYEERLFPPTGVAADADFLAVRPPAMHALLTVEHHCAHVSAVACWRILLTVVAHCRCWRA